MLILESDRKYELHKKIGMSITAHVFHAYLMSGLKKYAEKKFHSGFFNALKTHGEQRFLKYKFGQVLVPKNKLAVKIGHCGLSNKTNRFFPRKTSPEQNKLFLPIVLIFLSSA